MSEMSKNKRRAGKQNLVFLLLLPVSIVVSIAIGAELPEKAANSFGSMRALCIKAGIVGVLDNVTRGGDVAAGIWRWK